MRRGSSLGGRHRHLEANDPAGLGELRSTLEGIATAPDNGSKVVYLFHSDRNADSLLLLESTRKRIGFRRMSDPLDGIRTPEHMTEMGHHMVGHVTKESRRYFDIEASVNVSMSSRSESRASAPKLWVVLARAQRALAGFVEQCIATEGLCLSDFMVLEVLLHKGPMTISEIGQKVLLANASMTAAVDRLERKSLVSRESSPEDRRVRVVTLTKQGRAFISELYERHVSDLETVTGVLTGKEQDQLRALLKKLGYAAASAREGAQQ